MDDSQDDNEAIERLVVIGSSAGGVEALLVLAASLPEDPGSNRDRATSRSLPA
jgi:chemotaxis response regulator CheB